MKLTAIVVKNIDIFEFKTNSVSKNWKNKLMKNCFEEIIICIFELLLECDPKNFKVFYVVHFH